MAILDIFKKTITRPSHPQTKGGLLKPEKKKEQGEEKITKPIKEIKKSKKDYNPPIASSSLPVGKMALKPKREVISERKPQKLKEKKIGEAYRIIKSPQITEKATTLTEKNQYVFKVWPETNKLEIKKAVEDLYDVDVVSVRIIKVRSKKRKLGRISGWRQGYKKAIVRVKEGQRIEVLPR